MAEASIAADKGVGNALLAAGDTATATAVCSGLKVGHRFCDIAFPDLGLTIDLTRPPVAKGNPSVRAQHSPDWAYFFTGHGLDSIPGLPTYPMFTFGYLEKGVAFSLHRTPDSVYSLDPDFAKAQNLRKYSDLQRRDPARYAKIVERYRDTKVMLTVRLKATVASAK